MSALEMNKINTRIRSYLKCGITANTNQIAKDQRDNANSDI